MATKSNKRTITGRVPSHLILAIDEWGHCLGKGRPEILEMVIRMGLDEMKARWDKGRPMPKVSHQPPTMEVIPPATFQPSMRV